jgi:myo-inositol-1(or 4)-monophosphatase
MLPFAAELAVARHAAEAAGLIIAQHWATGVPVDFKGDIDLVTAVDHACEVLVLKALGESFGDDTIVGEEGGGQTGTSGRTWYVDPLDGTTNFSHGVPHCCVSIALFDAEGPAVGVIHDPIRRWTFYATRGGGAWRDGLRMQVSKTETLERSVLATGFPYDRRSNPDNNLGRTGALLQRIQGIRRAGSAALDLAWVAAGWLDGYWEDRLKPWDVAAGVLLVTEAGGLVGDLLGGDFELSAGRLTASNGLVHDALVAALRSAPVTVELNHA